MNKIQADYGETEFTTGKHLVLLIDGVQLDEIIAFNNTESHMNGLVPTLLKGWMDNKKESAIVWDRINLLPNEIRMVPLLMCPDDCDFSCTIIIAEMKLENEKVHLKKIGIDKTQTRSSNPKTIGRNVNWIKELGPYVFDKIEFDECIATFRNN